MGWKPSLDLAVGKIVETSFSWKSGKDGNETTERVSSAAGGIKGDERLAENQCWL